MNSEELADHYLRQREAIKEMPQYDDLLLDVERLLKCVEVLRDSMKDIKGHERLCLLGECCVDKTCSGLTCQHQLGSNKAYANCAEDASKALEQADKILRGDV